MAISTPSANTLERSALAAIRKSMAWTKNPQAYPQQFHEIWIRVIESGVESVHTFDTTTKAKKFQKNMMALRYAFLHAPLGPYRDKAGAYVAEMVNALTVRVCSVDDTERAQIASEALVQRREQDRAKGIDMIEFAVISTPKEVTP